MYPGLGYSIYIMNDRQHLRDSQSFDHCILNILSRKYLPNDLAGGRFSKGQRRYIRKFFGLDRSALYE